MKKYNIFSFIFFTFFLFEIINIDAKDNKLEASDKGALNLVASFVENILYVTEDAVYKILDPVQDLIKQDNLAILENPYKNMGASVREGGPLGMQELLFRENRFPVVKAAQEKMLGMKLEKEDVLEIGFSCSGGGWRAMCCSVGSCVGAKKIGLLDGAMYITAVSGSTWFLAPWIYSEMDLYDYKKRIIGIAEKGMTFGSQKEISAIFDNILVKFAYNQPLNIIDIYGALLTNSLLSGIAKDPYRVYLTDQRRIIDSGDFPMPVYNAVLGQVEMPEFVFEFTPYEVGTRWLKAYVPTWAFGRRFKKGDSKTYAPEQNMGFMMGIFGSAFAADFKDIYDVGINKIQLPQFLKNLPFVELVYKAIKEVVRNIAYATDLGDIRFTWARVPNFVYKLDESAHKNYKELKLVDAGLELNNPVFSNYRKPPFGLAPDIIFAFDYGTFAGFDEMQLLVNYAKNNGLKFPKVEKFEVEKSVIWVFKDDSDLEVPVIVYMPRINGFNLVDKRDYVNIDKYYIDLLKNFDMEKAVKLGEGFAAIYNFKYKKIEAETLIAMTEFNIISVQDKIKKIMKDRIELKRNFRNKKFK